MNITSNLNYTFKIWKENFWLKCCLETYEDMVHIPGIKNSFKFKLGHFHFTNSNKKGILSSTNASQHKHVYHLSLKTQMQRIMAADL